MGKVYVLGAGASSAMRQSAPLTRELLSRALDFSNSPSNGDRRKRARIVRKFINDFFLHRDSNASIPAGISPTIEDVLTQLDSAIEARRPLSHHYDIPTLVSIRSHLIFLISEVLRNALDEVHGGILDDLSTQQLRRRFVNSLNNDDTIISLNYDIMVDNDLFHRDCSFSRIDYSVQVRYELERVGMGWEKTSAVFGNRETPALLKLHGSLNWAYCPNCQELDISIGVKSVRYMFDDDIVFGCQACGTKYEAVVIAPSLLKFYQNPFLQHTWREAEKRIASAEEIVFLGYSMPDADAELRCMILRAVYKNWTSRNDGTGPRVRVIGRRPAKCYEPYNRYLRLFGKIDYDASGIENFIREMPRILDC